MTAAVFPYVCVSRDPAHKAVHGRPCRVIDSRQRATLNRVLVEFEDGARLTVHSVALRRRPRNSLRLEHRGE